MKLLNLFFILLIVSACSEHEDPINSEVKENDKQVIETNEQLIVRNIEGKLTIPATEDYSYKIYEAHLNGDDSVDYIITVNRLQKAIDEAIESENPAKRAEVGYIGNFNYFFYMDGATKEVSEPIAVPSSPHAHLKVSFNNVLSEAYKDFSIDFRIRNSCFRRFYTIYNRNPRQVFETKIFDGLGTENTEAYVIKYETGSYGLARDIVIYKGKLEKVELSKPNDIYTIDPVIEETSEIERRWFLNANEMKYFTRNE